MFQGFVDQGATVTLLFLTRDADGQPETPDAAPTFRLFGVSGAVAGGTGAATPLETGNVTGATNATPVVITAAAHGLPTGAYVKIAGVGGNTAANGSFVVTSLSANTFSLTGAAGNGAYTSGGTWTTVGLYKLVLSGAVLSALAAGRTYTVQLNWLVGGDPRSLTLTFSVQ